MKRENFIKRYRWIIIILTVLIVGLCIIPLTKTHINPDLESYLPETMRSIQSDRQIEKVFGDEETIMIVMESDDVLKTETLERLQKLDRSFSRQSAFKRVFSLFGAKNIISDYGMMIVDPVIKRIPKNQEEIENLRNEIKENDLAYKLVVSDDFRYALILLISNKTVKDQELIDIINQILSENPGPEEIMITGQPILRDEANRKIGRDIIILLPIGLIIMFFFLWLSFREIRGVLLPFSVVVFSILVCMSLIPLFGWELSIIGVLVPIMMLAIANNYGVYFIARYQDLNANNPNLTMNEIVGESFRYLFMPVLFCGLTTIAGILGLMAHILIPARQMGVVTGIGIGFALLVSLFFVPAILTTLKKGKPHADLIGEPTGIISKILHKTGDIITKKPKRTIVGFSIFFVFCVLGFFFFKLAPDNNNILPKNHSFNRAIGVVGQHFGGDKTITVMFEGDAKDPLLLKEMDRYEEELEKMPNVGSVTSLSTMVRKMSKALNDPEESGYDKIPDSRDAIAQYLELYSMSGDPEDLEQFVDFDYTNTLMTIQYNASNILDIYVLLNKIDKLMGNNPPPHVIGGFSLVDKEISESVAKGQNYSLLLALIAIAILISLIFKNCKAGLLGSLPLVFAVLCTFGIMGWLGLELNIVTALLSSISIGLGVDFTIQVFWRIKWELANGLGYADSVKATLRTIGRGIVINAFAVMLGFSALFLSSFPLVRLFGFLIILSVSLCLICALVLIPAICLVFKPKFLLPRGKI
jgi:predicted RND superfamily exporter protein